MNEARDARRRRSVFPGFRNISNGRQRIVEELVTARLQLGLSQAEVAAQMGTSQSAVARLEAGEADMRLSTVQRYAAAVGREVKLFTEGGTDEK
jgi:transcriptional regulator with XRE-family HTH domain